MNDMSYAYIKKTLDMSLPYKCACTQKCVHTQSHEHSWNIAHITFIHDMHSLIICCELNVTIFV